MQAVGARNKASLYESDNLLLVAHGDITDIGLDSLFFASQVDNADKLHLDQLPTFSLESKS